MPKVMRQAVDGAGEMYGDVRFASIVEVRPLASGGSISLLARQDAGDRSSGPTPELIVGRLLGGRSMTRVDVGAGRFRSDFRSRAMLVIPPDTPKDIYTERANLLHFVAVDYATLRTLCADASLPPDGDFGALHAAELHDATVEGVLDSVMSEVQAGNPNGALYSDGMLMMLAASLLRLTQRNLAPQRGGLAAWQVKRAQDYLADHLSSPVTLAELAAVVGLSPYHFARAFKVSTGDTPHRCHMRLRVDFARDLLSRTDMTVTDVALSVGFDSSQALARVFRKMVGRTPSAWRRDRAG